MEPSFFQRRIKPVCLHLLERARESRRIHSPEFEQAVVRLAVGTVVLLYVLFFQVDVDERINPHALAGAFFLVSSFLLVHILLRPGDFAWRKVLGIINDIVFITVSIYIAGRDGQPVYLVYLWVIFGNGFRYGRAYLNLALTLALIGFAAIMLIAPYWREHSYQGLAMLAGLALLSGYFGTLLNRLNDVLKAEAAANQAKRQFISSVSHELRTPLNAIIGITDLLQTTPVTAEQKDMLGILKSASKLMHALVDDVLDFSKIEAGKLSISLAPFDVRDLVFRCADMFRHQARERGIELEATVPDAVPDRLIGDAHHLRQVLVNLLSNAVKFTERGSVTLRTSIAQHSEGRLMLLFEVEDTGIGIDPAAQRDVFESFTQAAPSISQRFGGTGLGTAIAQQLVQLMGGHIQLRSEPGKGSNFYFTLDFEAVENDSRFAAEAILPDSAPEDAESSGTGSAGPSLHVLVADDNPVNQSILERVLARAGHTCTLVANGDEALDRLEYDAFNAIVLDMHMPVLDGLETVKAYRLLTPADMRIPVIIFSADANVETERECLEAGAVAFLSKPIDVDRFLRVLESLSAGSQATVVPDTRPRQNLTVQAAMPLQHRSASLDYAVLAMLESVGRDPAFVGSLIDSFCADTELNLRRLDAYLKAGDVVQFHAIAHAMQGSAAGIGAVSLEKCCQRCRTVNAASFAETAAAACQAVRTEYAAASHALAMYKRNRTQNDPEVCPPG